MTLTKAATEKNFDEFKKIVKAILLMIIGVWFIGVVLVAGGLRLLSAFF